MKKIRIHHYMGKTLDTDGRSTWESIQVELLVGFLFGGIAFSMYRLGSTFFFVAAAIPTLACIISVGLTLYWAKQHQASNTNTER
ncbi:hypothetical protein QWY82_00930 [Simiduia curdlanivorans]|uniref:Uncharacterized protein n=1 Tax=Simiduia curdlanivorans TaxID=1492769 RepID=A0ABV8V3J4_9GAMM|nr:hypothetical protein [Simiduia curdlanivorans]MDN3637358.1 hypothetical protein [Simiduia curdlanivorans]